MEIRNKPNIIFIDDEIRILRSLKMIFRRTHNVYITTDPAEFRRLIRQNYMHVIVCDQRMPLVAGTQLLSEAKEISPLSVRLLLTGYADLNAVIDSINEGEIYRYITKPWDSDRLKIVIQEATDIALALENSGVGGYPGNNTNTVSVEAPAPKLNLMVMFESKRIYERFQKQFGRQFNIFWANDINATMDILNEHDIALVVTDVHFCRQEILPVVNALKEMAPDIMTLIVTKHQDSRQFIELINQGQIFRCLVRPVTAEQLGRSMNQAAKKHIELRENPQLRQQVKVDRKESRKTEITGAETEESIFDGLVSKIRHRFGE